MLLEAESEHHALERLHEMGCTDGLPVVIPTSERVEKMIIRVDLDPDLALGEVGPKMGMATIEKLAVSAVMAGCLPDHFPVVIAAIKAVCRKEFDLTEVNQTTHCLAPVIIVNGPARNDCGPIMSGAGILGPGNRASACIGRALSLAMINIGGRQPGVTDMAVFSTPGKFTACFAEDEENAVFEPYHVSQGYDIDESTATVIGVEAPHSVILEPKGNDIQDAQRLLQAISGVVANPGSNHVYRAGEGGLLVVLNPEHAQILRRADYDRQSVLNSIRQYATITSEYADSIYNGLNVTHDNDDKILHAVRDPDQIMLIVAGGNGAYSMVLPSWAYAPHGNLAISELIEVFPTCHLPFE